MSLTLSFTMNSADRFRVFTQVQDYVFEDNVTLFELNRVLREQLIASETLLQQYEAQLRNLTMELRMERSTVDLLSNAAIDNAIRADNNAILVDLLLEAHPTLIPFARTARRRLHFSDAETVTDSSDDED